MFRQFSVVAATAILCWPAASSGQTSAPPPKTRVFGAYSLNIDFVEDLPYAFIVNQAAAPFFSHGSGPFGFEASIERRLRGHFGMKASVSGYVDPFRGTASYCQPASCAVSLTFEDDASAVYFLAGPVITARESKRTALFAHALVGAVRSSSTFRLAGNNVRYIAQQTARHPHPRHQQRVRAAAHSVLYRSLLGRRVRRDIWRRIRRQARVGRRILSVGRGLE